MSKCRFYACYFYIKLGRCKGVVLYKSSCVFRRVVLKNVRTKWWGQWIRPAGFQPFPVVGWVPDSTRGTGCSPGPAHRLFHRAIRRGGRVHSEVGNDSRTCCIPLWTHFTHSISLVLSDARWIWTAKTRVDGPLLCMHPILDMTTLQTSCWRLVWM